MRMNPALRWLLGIGAVGSSALLLTTVGSEQPPSERAVEHRLRALAASAEFRLHEARCIRDEALERRFVCLVGGPDDLHLALDVRWLPDGRLDVRRPDGSPVRF
jgi:hypothetical protein